MQLKKIKDLKSLPFKFEAQRSSSNGDSGSQATIQLDSTDRVLSGYALLFDQQSSPMYFPDEDGNLVPYYEVIPKIALNGADFSDVILDFNHNVDNLLARTMNGSLTLVVDDVGLKFTAKLNSSQFASDIFENVRSGLISQMSFWAGCTGYSSDETQPDGSHIITVDQLPVFIDVALVTFPQYSQTSVDISRSNLRKESKQETELKLKRDKSNKELKKLQLQLLQTKLN